MEENDTSNKMFKNPHFFSWNTEPSNKIKGKEEKFSEVSSTINILEDTSTSKENYILSLEKKMDATLNNV